MQVQQKICSLLVVLFLLSSSVLAALEPPELRLDDTVRPVRYKAELTLDPSVDTFQGNIAIDVHFARKTSFFWLNAADLKITEAKLTQSGSNITLNVNSAHPDFVGFETEEQIAAGEAQLTLQYTGAVSDRDTSGLFRMKDGEDRYLYTDFEPFDARRVFPCFDEPSYKVPWQLTLIVPESLTVSTNTAALHEEQTGTGSKKIVFAETAPLPSYLVALAVGPFEIVDAGRAGMNKTPVRILALKGRVRETQYAAKVTPQVLEQIEQYFGMPFPYPKLDQVVVPKTGYAMENAGMITYSERMILNDPDQQSITWERRYTSICAHEIAHQWFGDLVTLAWWDDIWLNESFASWMAARVLKTWKPEWEQEFESITDRFDAMESDSLATARKIRQPIETKDDIYNAFDRISYEKGQAVLEMFETWLGEKEFQNAVRRYLKKHAHGNATAVDFLAELSGGSQKEAASAFSTFLDQSGIPVVHAQMTCSPIPALQLNQFRYVQLGSKMNRESQWSIPVCYRYGLSEGNAHSACMILKEKKTSVALMTEECPQDVIVNTNASGYYHVLYNTDLSRRLVEGRLYTVPEKVSFIHDQTALIKSGDMAAGDFLELLPRLVAEPNRHVLDAAFRFLDFADLILVDDAARPQFQSYIRTHFGKLAHELGWAGKAGENDDTRLMRKSVLSIVAGIGGDPELGAEAKRLGLRWLQDPSTLDPEIVPLVLGVAASNGDEALLRKLWDEATKTDNVQKRRALVAAVGSVKDPSLASIALTLAVDGSMDPRDSLMIVLSMNGIPQTRHITYEFIRKRYDDLVAMLPRTSATYLMFAPGVLCDSAKIPEAEAFFRPRAEEVTGAPRNLDQAIERITACSAIRGKQQASVKAFLQSGT